MNKNIRRLRIALFVPIIAAAVGCGAVRGLACRICHRHDNECEPCAMNVSYSPGEVIEVGQPIVIGTTPLMPAPGVIVTPAPLPPPTTVVPPPSMKPVPEEAETELTPMPPIPPRLDSTEALPKPPAAKPGALSLMVSGSKGVASPGEEVTFEVKLENTGESPVSQVRMRANFSGNLRPKRVSPDGTAEIQGSSVVFQMINPFMPMTMSYQITADVIEDGDTGKVTVEVESPILMGDPLREEVTTRIAAP